MEPSELNWIYTFFPTSLAAPTEQEFPSLEAARYAVKGNLTNSMTHIIFVQEGAEVRKRVESYDYDPLKQGWWQDTREVAGFTEKQTAFISANKQDENDLIMNGGPTTRDEFTYHKEDEAEQLSTTLEQLFEYAEDAGYILAVKSGKRHRAIYLPDVLLVKL